MTGRRDIDRLQDELEELFTELWRGPRFAGVRHGFRPHVDTFRTDDPPELTIVVELAGIDPKSIDLVVFERTLVIAGQRERSQPDCPLSYYQMEIPYGRFERRVALPEDVDVAGARATYERGLLTIVLPIAPAPPREARVSIQVRMSSG